MKKFLSLVLALAMTLSLGVTAFAADNDAEVKELGEGAELEVTGTTEGAVIKVLVPTRASLILNPYEVEVEAFDGDANTEQILSAPQAIKNRSSLAILVGVNVTAETEGEVQLIDDEHVDGDSETKDLVLNFKYETVVVDTEEFSENGAQEEQIVSDGNDAKAKKVAKLEEDDRPSLAANPDGDSNTATSELLFGFSGEANAKAASAWTSEDTVSATIVFTFAVDTSKIGS